MPALIFLFAGFSTVVIQSLFIRELLVVFQGNELSVGIILSQWLIGTALGNLLSSKLKHSKLLRLNFIYLVSGFLVLLMFFLTRDARALLGIFPGEGISLKTTFITSVFILLPLGAFVGAQFTLAFSFLRANNTRYPSALGYIWESLGCFAGGIIFTYLALPFINSAAIGLFMTALFFAAAGLASSPKLRMGLLIVFILTLFSLPWASRHLENYTLKILFSGFDVEEVVNTPYAQLVSAQRNGERYIFSDGIPMLSLPNTDIERSEIFSHLPLLFHPAPENVLVIGGAARFVRGALDHGAKLVDYAEQDPGLLLLIKKYWPDNFQDPRLRLHYLDGRRFLVGTERTYDAILIGVPYPSSLTQNRYYTEEFFRLAARKLSNNGILALAIPGSLVYVSSAMGELNATVKKTLDGVFPYSLVIPGEENILIASNSELNGRSVLKKRFERIADKTFFVSKSFIDYALNWQRREWLRSEMDKFMKQAPVNRDYYPGAVTASLIWWQSIFAPNVTSAYAFVIKYCWLLYLFPLVLLFWGRPGTDGTAFSSGFCAMGLQMASIWGLQISSGNIYQLVGALNALFMAGAALGAAISGNSNIKIQISNIKYPIFLTEILFCCWIALWGAIFFFPPKTSLVFFSLSTGTGFLLGFQFPILSGNRGPSDGNDAAGAIYSFDLLGGWLAAILVGTVLIPAGGFLAAAAFLFLTKAATSFWWMKRSKSQP